MTLGTSIFLIAVGAIIRYGLTFHVSGVSRPTIGLILIIAGIVGVVLSLFYMATARRRVVGGPYEERRL
jgi:phosphate/sulfate permease